MSLDISCKVKTSLCFQFSSISIKTSSLSWPQSIFQCLYAHLKKCQFIINGNSDMTHKRIRSILHVGKKVSMLIILSRNEVINTVQVILKGKKSHLPVVQPLKL